MHSTDWIASILFNTLRAMLPGALEQGASPRVSWSLHESPWAHKWLHKGCSCGSPRVHRGCRWISARDYPHGCAIVESNTLIVQHLPMIQRPWCHRCGCRWRRRSCRPWCWCRSQCCRRRGQRWRHSGKRWHRKKRWRCQIPRAGSRHGNHVVRNCRWWWRRRAWGWWSWRWSWRWRGRW